MMTQGRARLAVSIAVSLGLACALAACAQRETVFLPTGQAVAHITCNLAPEGAVACYRAAGALCGATGYVLYDWNGQAWREPYPTPAVLENDPVFTNSGLLVACRR